MRQNPRLFRKEVCKQEEELNFNKIKNLILNRLKQKSFLLTTKAKVKVNVMNRFGRSKILILKRKLRLLSPSRRKQCPHKPRIMLSRRRRLPKPQDILSLVSQSTLLV